MAGNGKRQAGADEPSACDASGPQASAEQWYFELRVRLERMSAADLARFRAQPENRELLQRFDAHARRVALPYLLALSALLVFSLAAGAWLVS